MSIETLDGVLPEIASGRELELLRKIEALVLERNRIRAALKPFAEWIEDDPSTHGFLSDPAAWTEAKAAYQQRAQSNE